MAWRTRKTKQTSGHVRVRSYVYNCGESLNTNILRRIAYTVHERVCVCVQKRLSSIALRARERMKGKDVKLTRN